MRANDLIALRNGTCTIADMTSTTELEGTLPFYSPDDPTDERWRNSTFKNYAAYSLVPLDDDGRQELLNDLNTGEMTTNNTRVAPQFDFAGRTLRDVYDYHLQAREEHDNIHPHFFIVADQEDWRTEGVLVVCLYVDRSTGEVGDRESLEDVFEWVVGVMRCGVDMADCIGANLGIANVDWTEYKEEEEELWGGEDCYKNKRYFRINPITGQENQ
ncbi:hypothetical protein E4T47_04709 [Aureobasidium subglaciale]|nr:hypothetical protein E4T47_04709 [Aureobasidium subglaciale]